jgi:Zn-dependent peptidase ImmA (M78 family)
MNSSFRKKISENRKLLQNPYALLNWRGDFDAIPFKFSDEIIQRDILMGIDKQKKKQWTNSEIEQVVTNLQNKIWTNRNKIWLTNNIPADPLDIIDPVGSLSLINYNYDLVESLGQFKNRGKMIEVAGIIDKTSKRVSISRQFPNNVQNFTAAHELGHALLHNTSGLHRDKSLDGSSLGRSREPIEKEADKFATFFLMPEKQVKKLFKQLFGTDCFSLNDETSFALSSSSSSELEKKCQTLHGLSKTLAAAEYYNGSRFDSLAKKFNVSIEAMAIRLEELKLLR